MKYSFEKFVRDGFLHARIQGDNDVPTTRRYIGDLVRACEEENCVYVLVEENLEGPRLSVTEIFSIISERVAEVRSAIRVMAFVDASPERLKSNVQFGETVSVNRGMTVKVFDTLKEAETWLRKKISR